MERLLKGATERGHAMWKVSEDCGTGCFILGTAGVANRIRWFADRWRWGHFALWRPGLEAAVRVTGMVQFLVFNHDHYSTSIESHKTARSKLSKLFPRPFPFSISDFRWKLRLARK